MVVQRSGRRVYASTSNEAEGAVSPRTYLVGTVRGHGSSVFLQRGVCVCGDIGIVFAFLAYATTMTEDSNHQSRVSGRTFAQQLIIDMEEFLAPNFVGVLDVVCEREVIVESCLLVDRPRGVCRPEKREESNGKSTPNIFLCDLNAGLIQFSSKQ